MTRNIPTDTRHTVVVRYIDDRRRNQEVRFADWTLAQAVERAWKFIKPKVLNGEALCFRCIMNPESML